VPDFVACSKTMKTVVLVVLICIKYYLFHDVIAIVKSTIFK
jgi:ABC-type protease/lipase transport system fused ATPase/permease subunit